MDKQIEEKIDTFFKKFKHQIYKKGEILIRADDNPSGIFYLKEGHVKEYAISQKGDELIVNIFKPVSFFPMSWAVNGTANEYYFEAMTAVEVWRAPKDAAVEFIKTNPDVIYDLLRRVYMGTDGMLLKLTYLMAGNAYARIVAEIIIQAKRFGKTSGESVEIKISEKDLGAQTGMTRETVSREIKVLRDRGLINYSKGKLIILNLGKFKNELLI